MQHIIIRNAPLNHSILGITVNLTLDNQAASLGQYVTRMSPK